MTDARRSGPDKSVRKGPWAVRLADLVGPCLAPAAAKQGFSTCDIVMHWADIVGPRLAAFCEPIRLQWPPRARQAGIERTLQSATLVVRVEGAFAIELQHLAAVVIERANAHLGWRCVDRLAFRQGPVTRPPTRRPARPGVDADAAARAAELTADIESDGLREALARLGAHVLAGKPR